MASIQTQADYKEYEASVARNTDGYSSISTGPIAGCSDCLDVPDCPTCGAPYDDANDPPEDWYDLANEPGISSSPCDTCGCCLQGDRFPAHGIDKESKPEDALTHFDICVDCLYYVNYGRLDDLTMERIGA